MIARRSAAALALGLVACGPPGASNSSPERPYLGTVVVWSNDVGFTVRAPLATPSARAASCPSSAVGGCVVRACLPEPPPVDGATPAFIGAVTVRSGSTLVPVTLDPAGGYAVVSGNGPLYTPSSLTVAAGGDLAYGDFSITLPPPPNLVYAVPGESAGEVVLDRARDFAIAWAKASGDAEAELRVVARGDGESVTSMVCTAPVSAGALVVPAAAIAALPPSGSDRARTLTLSLTTVVARAATLSSGERLSVRAERQPPRQRANVVVR